MARVSYEDTADPVKSFTQYSVFEYEDHDVYTEYQHGGSFDNPDEAQSALEYMRGYYGKYGRQFKLKKRVVNVYKDCVEISRPPQVVGVGLGGPFAEPGRPDLCDEFYCGADTPVTGFPVTPIPVWRGEVPEGARCYTCGIELARL